MSSSDRSIVRKEEPIINGNSKQTTGTPSLRPSSQSNSPYRPVQLPEHSFEMDESEVMTRAAITGGSIRSFISATGTGSWSLRGGEKFMGAARHTAGLILLLGVVILWTLSNFLGSSIFANSSYAKPFFLTYLNTSIFVFAMIPSWLKWGFRQWRAGTLRSDSRRLLSAITFKSLLHKGNTDPLLQEEFPQESVAFLKPAGVPSDSSEASSRSSTCAGAVQEPSMYLGLIPTARLSLVFCLLWFSANYFAMSCLQHTTVASTTILTSTSSVWTLLIGALSRTEKFTWRKLCGVLASLSGIIIISRADLTTSPTPVTDIPAPPINATNPMMMLTARAIEEFPDKGPGELAIGDAQALLSAIIYGLYIITLKQSTLKATPLELHMPTFFGLVGIFNIILLLPLFPILDITGIEPFQLPPTKHVWVVLIINSISSFASDIMWAHAMILTSPLVVTVGISLTIPLSLISEIFVQARYEGWIYWVGAMIVVGGFVFVEREEVKEVEERDEIGCVRNVEEGGSSGSQYLAHANTGAGIGGSQSESDNDAARRVSQDLSDLIDSDDDDQNDHNNEPDKATTG